MKGLYLINATLWLINSVMWFGIAHTPFMGVICGLAFAGCLYAARQQDY